MIRETARMFRSTLPTRAQTMVAAGSMRRWFLFNLRRAVGTQVLIERFVLPTGAGIPAPAPVEYARQPAIPKSLAFPAATEPPMVSAAAQMLRDLYTRIADASLSDEQLGFHRDQVPVLVDLNGDLLWLPGDLLKYVTHTRQNFSPAYIVHLLAETPHYMWIRDRLRPGDTVLDCGANLGLFATMMAARVGPTGAVHAFEPSPRARHDLARVVHLNELSWVVISPFAVADKCGQATFCDVLENDVRREASHLSTAVRFTANLAKQSIEVPTITLDRYLAETGVRPRLVKIDVEGAELEVLDGARDCLRRFRPLLVIEIHPDAQTGQFDHERLKQHLVENNYAFTTDNREYYCEPR